jgi:subfamily B ATP-binding cassette protein MsbA
MMFLQNPIYLATICALFAAISFLIIHFRGHMMGPPMFGGPPQEAQAKVQFKKTYFRLLRYAKPYWYLVTIVLLLSLSSTLIGVLPAQVMGVAVNEITGFGETKISQNQSPEKLPKEDARSAQSSPRGYLSQIPIAPYITKAARYVSTHWLTTSDPRLATAYVLAGSFLLLFIVSQLISVCQGFIMAHLGQSLIFDMRSHVYAHLQKLSLKYFEDRQTGDIMSRVVNDVNSLEQVIVHPILGLLTDIFSLAWILYFCLSWDWVLTLIALVAVPLLIVVTYFFGGILRRNFRKLRQVIGELNGLLQDNLSGIRVIKGFAREEYEQRRFDDKSRDTYKLNVKLAKLFMTFRPLIDLLNQVGTILVLFYGSIKVFSGDMTPGVFIMFFQYLPRLYGPLTGLTGFYNHIQQALASSERVFEVLDTEPDVKESENAIDLPRIVGNVQFRDVHFSYDGKTEVLRDINLKSSPGQMIAFVGPSGAGKTTLTNLIPRFYDPTQGEIFIDGYNLRDIKSDSLRKQMGIVLQETFLFNDTIKNNIAYGKIGATDEEIIEAAKAANAHEFIMEFPEKYKTLVGERGVKLSGGQKQRISIARAILADPRILIFDEATSSVDSETEILIQKAINNLVQNRTTFVIAHRLSTIQNADLIIVLDQGEVVEMGAHDELLAKGGLYMRLHQVQFRLQSSPPEIEHQPQPQFYPPTDSLSNLEKVQNLFKV